jgi:hypothetical protein
MRVRDDAAFARAVGVEPQIEVGQVQAFSVFDSQQLVHSSFRGAKLDATHVASSSDFTLVGVTGRAKW